MSDESGWSRDDIAQWVGTILWIVLLESHVISRPLVFLCGPFIMLSSFVIIAFPIRGKRLATSLPFLSGDIYWRVPPNEVRVR